MHWNVIQRGNQFGQEQQPDLYYIYSAGKDGKDKLFTVLGCPELLAVNYNKEGKAEALQLSLVSKADLSFTTIGIIRGIKLSQSSEQGVLDVNIHLKNVIGRGMVVVFLGIETKDAYNPKPISNLLGLEVDITNEVKYKRTQDMQHTSMNISDVSREYKNVDIENARSKAGFKYLRINVQGYLEFEHVKTGIVMILIPPGSFQMGSDNEEDEKPVHEVYLDTYFIGKYEVTQEEWKWVMGKEPWRGKDSTRDDAQAPAIYISWDDCQKFCEKTGLQLPTEAQWERACRVDTVTRFYWGDDLSEGEIGEYAWYPKNTFDIGEKYAHRVGQKRPNGFGLYDMSGNVGEWCQDWYGENYYSSSPTSNPTGPIDGSYRVYRGGSWSDGARYCRSANRLWVGPCDRYRNLGVRLCASFK